MAAAVFERFIDKKNSKTFVNHINKSFWSTLQNIITLEYTITQPVSANSLFYNIE